jgi:hypothetical protein
VTLEKLATRLGVAERQRRIGNGGALVAIAGLRGLVRPADDGSLIVVLGQNADPLALRQLIDANVIKPHGEAGVHRLQRLPNGIIEREAFCALLGLVCRREVAS